MKLKIKKNDLCFIKTGKDAGKTGKVLKVSTGKVIIEGINIFKKHAKGSKKYPQGGIIDINKPIDISNIMVICPNCKKAVRLRYKNSGVEKRRICIKCSEVADAS